MLASIPSATLLGVDGTPVDVEVHVSQGLPAFTVVGQPDTVCREARDRVRAAILSTGLAWPLRRITVNLAPSGVRKIGAGLDLAIAIGVLVASDVIDAALVAGIGFVGELGLDGSLRPVPGTVSLADAIDQPAVVVAEAVAPEAALVGRHVVRPAASLGGLLDCLRGMEPWPDPPDPPPLVRGTPPDLSDVRGQVVGRFALEVAAAGGHHVLLIGPPGSGKTMLARRLPGLLPPLDRDAALDVTRIHSAAGLPTAAALAATPPFRAPHHTSSAPALVGGGSVTMRPGEISCAHRGVLFLDELPEFPSFVLDTLRQPLEEGVIRIARARATATYPAKFLLVAAMNPCPCGDGGPPGGCYCAEDARRRYLRRVSGPLLDRFDLRVTVHRPEVGDLLGGVAGERSAPVAERVLAARHRAAERGVRCNADLPAETLDDLAPLTDAATRILDARLRAGRLSARGLHRVRRVARTIADLEGGADVDDSHVAAALELRIEPSALELAA